MYMLLQHNITEFAAIGGSRSLGIEEITSDTDLIIVANNPDYQLRMKGGFNTLYKSPTDFYEMLTLSSRNYIHIFQFLYPERFMTDNEFTDWIIKNRDELFAENKKVLYDDTCNFLKNTQQNLDAYYKVAAKKISHALAYGKIAEQYSSGVLAKDCFKATDNLRDILLKIRNKQIPYEDVKKLVNTTLLNIINIQEKTAEPILKPKSIELKEILDSTYFEDYTNHL